jgi:hypothetical protein
MVDIESDRRGTIALSRQTDNGWDTAEPLR